MGPPLQKNCRLSATWYEWHRRRIEAIDARKTEEALMKKMQKMKKLVAVLVAIAALRDCKLFTVTFSRHVLQLVHGHFSNCPEV